MPHFKFQVSRMSGRSSKTPLSTISWLDPWRTCWFLMHNVWIVDVLEVSCFKFQLTVTSGTPSKTPYPPSPGWILWGHVGCWCILYGYLLSFRFHDSNFSSLWHQEHHQRHPYPPSPNWILGGHGCFIYTFELVLRATTNLLLKCSKLIHCVINTDALSCVETHD